MTEITWGITNSKIMKLVPKTKQGAIREIYQDDDGIWIILKDGWNADNMDSDCRTIHCGGEDEPLRRTLDDLKNQIRGIRRKRREA